MPDLLTGRLNEYDAKRYFSRFGWFAFTYFLLSSIVSVIIAIITINLFPAVYQHYLFSETLNVVVSYGIALPISYVIIKPLPTVKPDPEKMKVSHWFYGLCISVALMIIGNYITSIVLVFFISPLRGVSMQSPVSERIDSVPLWVTILFIVIIAPILEEIFFRGILCKKLTIIGEGYAIILPSAFFALCHGNFFQLFYAFTLGCFFSFIYIKTGKLIYTIIYHMAINLIGSVISPLIIDQLDITSLLENGFSINSENILRVIGFLWYELIIVGVAIFGVVIAIKKRKEFKVHEGLLPPPEHKGVSCVLLNSGVAASIAIFAYTLLGSLLL
ncbi:MAG: CPBP family intramembrane metalloprotease [Clostridia bacterium]|nr:CPBP family intramembrane metalloprotease [Clostridia bacterium]